MAGVLERFHFLGKELKENVLKIKGKDFWKEKRTEGKKVPIRAFFHLGDLFFEWLPFSPFWGLCASWVFDLCSLVSLNRSCSLGLTQEGRSWLLRGRPALGWVGKLRSWLCWAPGGLRRAGRRPGASLPSGRPPEGSTG